MAFADTVTLLKGIVLHIAANPGKLPGEKLAELHNKIIQETSLYTDDEFKQLIDQINKLKLFFRNKEDQVHLIVTKLLSAYCEAFERVIFEYNQRISGIFSDKSFYADNKNDNASLESKKTSFFEYNLTPEQETWRSLKKTITHLSWRNVFGRSAINNSLTALITLDDNAFLTAMWEYKIIFSEEIGHLALQRIRDIIRQCNAVSFGQRTEEVEKNLMLAHKCLRQFSNPMLIEGLFHCDQHALEVEIAKLALHGLLYPEKKKIWIGTARAVDAMIQKYPGDAMYFNPRPNCHTWGLNRAWLQAAVAMKYEIRLVEQHYPNIEHAILSANPAHFLLALAAESRPSAKNDSGMHSQYHGGASPTATPQEILVLMEMHCVAKKNEDGSISFYQPKTQDDMILNQSSVRPIMKRSHTSPDLRNIAPLPPFASRKDHFKTPGNK